MKLVFKLYFLIGFMQMLISCTHENSINEKKELQDIIINEIDTIGRKDSIDYPYKISENYDLIEFRYINYKSDSLDLSVNDNYYFLHSFYKIHWYLEDGEIYYPYFKNLQIFPPGKTEILLRSDIIYRNPFILSDNRFQIAHPLLVYNSGNDTFNISGLNSELIIEALDSNRIWNPLNDKFHAFCGTGEWGVDFYPNSVGIIPIPIFKGEFSTKIRIKFNNQYSNTIDANIHYSQFSKIPE